MTGWYHWCLLRASTLHQRSEFQGCCQSRWHWCAPAHSSRLERRKSRLPCSLGSLPTKDTRHKRCHSAQCRIVSAGIATPDAHWRNKAAVLAYPLDRFPPTHSSRRFTNFNRHSYVDVRPDLNPNGLITKIPRYKLRIAVCLRRYGDCDGKL